MNRRNFIKSIGLLNLAMVAPWAFAQNSHGRSVVFIELKGGNDGLNTLIPYSDPAYYQARPRIAVAKDDAIALTADLGMHPALAPLASTWEEGNMAWVQGLGYASPNRSHFRSIEIWNSASTEDTDSDIGWVGDVLTDELKGISIGSSLGPLYDEGTSSLSINNLKQFVRLSRHVEMTQAQTDNDALAHILEVQNSVDALSEKVSGVLKSIPAATTPFPKTSLGRHLESVYQLIAAGLNVPAYKVSLGGFDTHTGQKNKHAQRLKMLAEAIAAFKANLQQINKWDDTLLMTYSEFGRRLKENANQGTDHGTAAPHMVMGGKVKGGLYGAYPSLTDLDRRGDLKYTTDFRDLYTTIAEGWWEANGVANGNKLGFV